MSVSFSSAFPGAELEPGDRFEVAPIGSTGRLSLPRVLGPDGFPIDQIEDPAGRALDLTLDPTTGSLVVPKLSETVRGPPRRHSGWSIGRRGGSA